MSRFLNPIAATALSLVLTVPVSNGQAHAAADSLKSPDEFASIVDEAARGKAMFKEIGKVIQSPRCLNCHPAGDTPLQGDDMHVHEPPVARGEGGMGVAGMRCNVCHQSRNIDHAGLPGHPLWHLAPKSMAWAGVSLGDICRQIKDKDRNGGMDMAALTKHMAEDSLVGWGWDPDKGRRPAPGTQTSFGILFAAWAASGAHCPD